MTWDKYSIFALVFAVFMIILVIVLSIGGYHLANKITELMSQDNHFRYIIWWKPTKEYRIIPSDKLEKHKSDPNAVLVAGPYYSKGEAQQALQDTTSLDKIREELL